jgi:O-antigen/teichoic acid export membrane protein
MALTISCILHSFDIRSVAARHLRPASNWHFFKQNIHHITKVGSAEVLAMASSNLPIMLINFWFSALTAGYFSVVSRFCLAPVVIIGNAVRNTIFPSGLSTSEIIPLTIRSIPRYVCYCWY